MPIQAILDPRIPAGSLPYSPACRVGNLLFISGQASLDDRGEYVSDTFEGEMRRSLANLRTVLAVTGMTLSHVVQVRSYLAHAEDLDVYNRIYQEFFTRPFPARTTLVGCLGDVVKFEIDAIADAGSI
jgi:2-iminobutanoate/2-iminopropanoate deaminase